MRQANFEIEFITPAILGGAAPHEWGELRVPSIRGQLRWWFRMLGHSAANEGRIFGSVAGDAGRGSAVIVRVSDLILSDGKAVDTSRGTHRFEPALGAENIGCGNINSGEGYLAFNLRRPRDAALYKRGMITEKTRFTLHLTSGRLSQTDFHVVCQVTRLFAQYGSLGTRSRRTFGCLQVIKESGDLSATPANLANFPNRRLEWRDLPTVRADSVAQIRRVAGEWLRQHRRNPDLPNTKRGQVFGEAGLHSRLASPVILRPTIAADGAYRLGLIVPHPLPKLIADAIA